MAKILSRAAALPAGITATSGTIRDFRIIEERLNAEILKIKKRANKGLLLAAIEVRRDMEIPKIPRDYGNLEASWFITTKFKDSSLSHLEVKTAEFNTKAPKEVVEKVKAEHPMVIQQAQSRIKYQVGVAMGFTAYYAAAVHEMKASPTGKPIKWKRPGSGPKFFQASLYRNFDTILTIVAANTRVP